MQNEELIQSLRSDAEWAHANEWETPLCMGDNQREAADLIESLRAQLADYHHMSELVGGKMGENQRLRRINENLQEQLAASQRRAQDARNELCIKCGRYHEAHNGACDGCRWRRK